jgi:DNA-3-methyladenine glycosylase
VLIRALEPLAGIETMRARRAVVGRVSQDDRLLCAGPGRVGQALGLGPEHDGLRVDAPPFQLVAAPHAASLVVGARIGISKATDKPWRFGLAGSPFLSRPFR